MYRNLLTVTRKRRPASTTLGQQFFSLRYLSWLSRSTVRSAMMASIFGFGTKGLRSNFPRCARPLYQPPGGRRFGIHSDDA